MSKLKNIFLEREGRGRARGNKGEGKEEKFRRIIRRKKSSSRRGEEG